VEGVEKAEGVRLLLAEGLSVPSPEQDVSVFVVPKQYLQRIILVPTLDVSQEATSGVK